MKNHISKRTRLIYTIVYDKDYLNSGQLDNYLFSDTKINKIR